MTTQPEALRLADALRDATYLLSVERKATESELRRLHAENKALRADAERYRWLRDNPWPPVLEADILLHRNARWDAEIDAAMKEKT